MADERRYGGEPRPLPPVNEQAAADLQGRLDSQRAAFADYKRLNDASTQGIAEAWAAGGPSPAAAQLADARHALEVASNPPPDVTWSGPANAQVAAGFPEITPESLQQTARLTANLDYRQAQTALASELTSIPLHEVAQRMSGLTEAQYAGLNPRGRFGDPAGPGHPGPQGAPADARQGDPAGPQQGGPGEQGGPAAGGQHGIRGFFRRNSGQRSSDRRTERDR